MSFVGETANSDKSKSTLILSMLILMSTSVSASESWVSSKGNWGRGTARGIYGDQWVSAALEYLALRICMQQCLGAKAKAHSLSGTTLKCFGYY